MPEKRKPGPVPKEALTYFTDKKLQPSFDYRDVWREEHAHAFTVAKMTQVDLLGDVRDSLAQAIEEGQTFAQWSAQLTPKLQQAGWWGVKEARDPITGELKTVQLGSPRRLKTIYRSNMRTARAAGQWERIERDKKARPYLLYRLGPSENHRPEHASWDGLLLPVDDPFWTSHYPPNGWGCKCHIRQVSQREYDRYQKDGIPTGPGRQELNPQTGLPTGRLIRDNKKPQTKAPPPATRQVVNKRTGEVENVPQGIDPGWDTNPGLARKKDMRQRLDDKESRFRERLKEPLPETRVSNPVFGEDDPALFTTGNVTQESIEATLAGVPGNEPQRDQLRAFLEAHPQKLLFISPTQMSVKTGASKAIEGAVGQHLGQKGAQFGRLAYVYNNPARVNGFTSSSFEHVVIKVPVSESLDIASEDLARGIKEVVASYKSGKPLFSMSSATGALAGKKRSLLTTMIHELGHQIHFWANSPARPPGSIALTRYGNSNAYEWHAEHFTAWFYNRAALAEAAPDIATYFDNLVATATSSATKGK